ncbi:MAG: hypothetical protein ACLFM0_01985 [Spirochaetales bacterium]
MTKANTGQRACNLEEVGERSGNTVAGRLTDTRRTRDGQCYRDACETTVPIKHPFSFHNLSRLYRRTVAERIPQDRPAVVFSDFHAGDGGARDDFVHNADLAISVLEEYFRRGYRLVLNGDVEELQKFPLEAVRRQWKPLYRVFDRFQREGRLERLVGNHDLDLMYDNPLDMPVHEALRWEVGDEDSPDTIFIFHGHQASRQYELYNDHVGWFLRNIVSKLPVKNRSVSANNFKKKAIEERIYEFSRRQRIVSIIGHTHRPLFESLSKTDWVKYNIERLCRQYGNSDRSQREGIRVEIDRLKGYLARTVPDKRKDIGSIYHETFVVPSMFNAGCVLGKRGLTCIELDGEDISLKYWADSRRSNPDPRYAVYDSVTLPGTAYRESVIQSESLRYIFSRIHLLS